MVLQVLCRPKGPFLHRGRRTMKVELLGGALDGLELDSKKDVSLPVWLQFPAPKIFKDVQSGEYITQCIYERMLNYDGKTYYMFIGWK